MSGDPTHLACVTRRGPPGATSFAPASASQLDLSAGIARLAWLCTASSALIWAAALAGAALSLLLGIQPTRWLVALVDIGPFIAVFLGNIATFAGHYGAKNQNAQVPSMLQDVVLQLRRRVGQR